MMEKIKINLPEKTYELLRKDAKDFRILKPSGEENLNAFLNKLVVNFYEDFSADDDSLRESIQNALSSIPEKYAKVAFPAVMNAIVKREKEDNLGKSVSIAFKPTKATEFAAVYIENVLLKNEALSSFYRRLFSAYSKKLKNEREKIIHKQNYELLSSAVKKGLQVCISLDNGEIYNNVSVYGVEPAKDELFNYALLYVNKTNKTIRLAKISTVSVLAYNAEMPSESKDMFARQVIAGAQYPIYSTDNGLIKVQLSKKGKQLFERIYLYRPTPIAIEDDVYIFDCSANQVLYYFERFGSDALILAPRRLGVYMRNYYHFALKKYRSIYGKDGK